MYWKAGDPTGATRTWQHVMEEIPKLKTDDTRPRWLTAIKDAAFDTLRKIVVHFVDEVLTRFGVLPLNNPPYFPRYNGGMEKSIRDFKAALALHQPRSASELGLLAEVVAHELNHHRRRCLKRRTACVVFHDDAQRLRWTKPSAKPFFVCCSTSSAH